MAGRKQTIVVRCEFADKGEDVRDILLSCFRFYLYREMQKHSIF